MATGERKFDSSTRQVVQPNFKPFAPGEYDLKIGTDWEIRTAEGQGRLPYLNGSFEVLGTAASEGGKNKKVFHRFFLDLSPAKDGVSMVDRGNGITAFAKSAGTTLEVAILQKPKGKELIPVDILAPKETLRWLLAMDGTVVRAHVKIEKGTGGYQDKNVVGTFIEVEEAASEESEQEEENEEADAEEADEAETDEADESEESEDDEEESIIPPPKKKTNAPAKPVAKKKK
jgi:hypothetical protein